MASNASTAGSSGWEPPEVEELQKLLPQYEITELIGSGGMGAVYLGKQTTLDRPVAIKVLPETLTDENSEHNFIERFKLEARAMANLDHPAIISVYDFGETREGHLYFVMEFIDGMDLQKYIEVNGGQLKEEHAIAVIAHVLDALQFAHENGIIHRDIKPANVLINSRGQVKIADFGLAKNFDEAAKSSGLTMTNVAMGTPDFMAPEAMLDSSSADSRADLYAVGVMLYQMLTGRLPRGMFKMPHELDSSRDQRFDDIIAKALEPDPEHRFGSADDFREKIDELLTTPVTQLEGNAAETPAENSTPGLPGGRQLITGASSQVSSVAQRGSQISRRPAKPVKGKSPAALVAAIVVVATALAGGAFFLLNRGDDDSAETLVNQSEPEDSDGVNAETADGSASIEFPLKRPEDRNYLNVLRRNQNAQSDVGLPSIPPDLGEVVQVAFGLVPFSDGTGDDGHAAALLPDGTVRSWGGNLQGQTDVPEELRDVVKVTCGSDFQLALLSDGTVTAWGADYSEPPAGLSQVIDIQATAYHAIALKIDGTVMTWGRPVNWEFAPPEGLTGIVKISAGHDHFVSLRRDGTVAAWGNNSSGQTNVPDPLKNVKDVAAGYFRSYAVTHDGRVHSWGAFKDVWASLHAQLAEIDDALALRNDIDIMVKTSSSGWTQITGHLFNVLNDDDQLRKNFTCAFATSGHAYLVTPISLEVPSFFKHTLAEQPEANPSPPTSSKEFTSLMNGEDLSDWKRHGPDIWRVEEDAIVATGGGGQRLLYREYAAPWFELNGQFKVSARSNGGIIFRIPDPSKKTDEQDLNDVFNEGFQFQLIGSGGNTSSVRMGGLFTPGGTPRGGPVAAGSKNVTGGTVSVPDDTWTEFRLEVRNKRIRAWIENEQTVDLSIDVPATGGMTLGLSNHALEGTVGYRNLRIRALAPKIDAMPDTITPIPEAPAANDPSYSNIMNGKDLSGWKVWGADRWRVENGAALAQGLGFSYLYRENSSPYFELEGDINLSPLGNGGILFWVPDPTTIPDAKRSADYFARGFQLQLTGSKFKGSKADTGKLFEVGPDQKLNRGIDSLPDDTWARFRIEVHKDRIRAWLGSEQTVDVATPTFGKDERTSGRFLAIQKEQTAALVGYRNLRIRPLEETPSQPDTSKPQAPKKQNIKELTDLLGSYNQARSEQLIPLLGSYRKNLAKEKNKIADAGDLDGVKFFQGEEEALNGFESRIKEIMESGEGTPLPDIPIVNAFAPESLKRLRGIFDSELAKIDKDLAIRLQTGFNSVEAKLTRDGRIDDAEAVREYRDAVVKVEESGGKAPPPPLASEWTTLFDGKTLDGWKGVPDRNDFKVESGILKIDPSKNALLYFIGKTGESNHFKDFELQTRVKVVDGGNSGIYFHTTVGTAVSGSAARGHEVQVWMGENNRTGTLHAVPDATSRQITLEGVWYDLTVRVEGKEVTTFINGNEAYRWKEAANWSPPPRYPLKRLGSGTFSLQAYVPSRGGPIGRVYFDRIRVKRLD